LDRADGRHEARGGKREGRSTQLVSIVHCDLQILKQVSSQSAFSDSEFIRTALCRQTGTVKCA
ncbi:MAG TPA: hypothetical protein VLK83_04790, partial [Rhodanobacteraceae bacterium]|nr:hypothetical protein [Rhodanobacteraceae bacterium]